jgi:class 3 adenylate cyclase
MEAGGKGEHISGADPDGEVDDGPLQVALIAVFAATYPERTSGLVCLGYEGGRWTPQTPWRTTDEHVEEYLRWVERDWGTRRFAEEEGSLVWPDMKDDSDWWDHYARFMRRSVSPGDAAALLRIDVDTDVRDVWATIRVPTLVIHRVDDHPTAEEGRFVASRVPGVRLVELSGANHAWVSPDQDEILDEIQRFVSDLRDEEAEFSRTLATVLFTDIVGSTERAAAIGDRTWSELLERHHQTVGALLARFRGREVDTAGDGFFATFDGPARAVRCAQAIVEAVKPLGIEVRAGVHTGEVETTGEKLSGIAVVIGSRLCAQAAPSDVVVSSTVKDLVAGSGLVFDDRGEHELKGVPERWRLYRVAQ